MLEFDDIQHILLTRTPALTGRYEFLSFRNPAGGRPLPQMKMQARCISPGLHSTYRECYLRSSAKMFFLCVPPGTKMTPITTVTRAMMIGYHNPP